MQTLELEGVNIEAEWEKPNQLHLNLSDYDCDEPITISKKELHDLMSFLLALSKSEPEDGPCCKKGKPITDELLKCSEYRNKFTEEACEEQVKCKTCAFAIVKKLVKGECSNPASRLDGKTSVESDGNCAHSKTRCGECTWFKK